MRILLLIILFPAMSVSQPKITITKSCSYFGERLPTTVYKFPAGTEAMSSLYRITSAAGIPANFVLVMGNVPNACATLLYNASTKSYDRYIIYNPSFIQRISEASNDWAALSILAHEVGHHLSGHSLQAGGSRPEIELEADKFSGFILQKLGANVEEAKYAINLSSSIEGTLTHPAKRARLAAISNGWFSSYNQTGKSKTSNSQTTNSKPVKFIDYNNQPTWTKDNLGNLIIEKDGYIYPSNEFKTVANLSEINHLFAYSITEDATFYCEDFKTMPAGLKVRVKPINCYPNDNIFFIKHPNGGVWVIDKGVVINVDKNVPVTWIPINNEIYNGVNGRKYYLPYVTQYYPNKSYYPAAPGIPTCINSVQ